jgi:biotin transport system substrate-specific component
MNTQPVMSMSAPSTGRAADRAGLLVARAAAGVVLFALLTAAGARVVIPLPDTPVPVTLQTVVVLTAGVVLGGRLGLISMVFYVLLGTVGYEIFAGGRWGLQTVLGATGGYLVGFALAQPVVGWLTRRSGPATLLSLLAAVTAGKAIIFACGLAWLAVGLGVSPARALELGLWPFMPWMALKLALAAGAGALLLPLRRRWFDRAS